MFNSFLKRIISRVNGLIFDVPGSVDATCPSNFCRTGEGREPGAEPDLFFDCGYLHEDQQAALEALIPGFTWGDEPITIEEDGEEPTVLTFTNSDPSMYGFWWPSNPNDPHTVSLTYGETTIETVIFNDVSGDGCA